MRQIQTPYSRSQCPVQARRCVSQCLLLPKVSPFISKVHAAHATVPYGQLAVPGSLLYPAPCVLRLLQRLNSGVRLVRKIPAPSCQVRSGCSPVQRDLGTLRIEVPGEWATGPETWPWVVTSRRRPVSCDTSSSRQRWQLCCRAGRAMGHQYSAAVPPLRPFPQDQRLSVTLSGKMPTYWLRRLLKRDEFLVLFLDDGAETWRPGYVSPACCLHMYTDTCAACTCAVTQDDAACPGLLCLTKNETWWKLGYAALLAACSCTINHKTTPASPFIGTINRYNALQILLPRPK
jgi:hypothetical protein